MTWWQRLRESFWFVPALLCLFGVLLAEALVILDEELGRPPLGPLDALVYRVGASGSRDVLGAIAGSVLSVAATSFSITIAVLSLASSTYGPRLVRNFMADRGNQVVLGVYVATFLYSLLVLRSVQDGGDGPGDEVFVPHVAVNVAVIFAVLSVGVLIYFIHHISDSVQVWTLAQRTRDDLLRVVEHLYPEAGAGDDEPSGGQDLPGGAGVPVHASRDGYVIQVDEADLLHLASKHDAVVAMRVMPGAYCVQGSVLATAWPASGEDAARKLADGVRKHVALGDERTPHQDVEFAVQQLVEMAVRALSPSTNDPYTALNALDQVSAGLSALVSRPMPSSSRVDDEGALRLHAPRAEPAQLIEMVFDAVRGYALEHPVVLRRAAEVAVRIGNRARDPALRRQLAVQLDLLLAAYERTDPQEHDLQRLRKELTPVREELLGSPM